MKKVIFQYQKPEGIERKEVIILKENQKYIEGIELNDKITEDDYNKVMKNYRKFLREKIINTNIPFDINIIDKIKKDIEYLTEVDEKKIKEEIKEQIKYEKNRILESLDNIKILFARLGDEEDKNN